MKYFALNIAGQQIEGPKGIPTGGAGTVGKIISVGVNTLYIVAIILALGFLIYGGFQWMTSEGDKQKLQAARKKLFYAVAGLIVVLLAYLIVNIIGGLFGINNFI